MTTSAHSPKKRRRIALVLEQSLGHVTHAQNLRRALAAAGEGDDAGAAGAGVEPIYIELPYDGITDWWARLPVVRGNWSARASLAARIALSKLSPAPDAAFFHSQVTSLFSVGFMRRVPSVISLDATPKQYDTMGALYGHAADSENSALDKAKTRMNVRAFAAARHLVTWSQWAKDGLAEYGVVPEKVTVIPPGVDTKLWDFAERRAELRVGEAANMQTRRLLFVGGDFARKGGETLLTAMEQILARVANAQLDIVTKTDIAAQVPPTLANAVRIHHGVTPNSDVLRDLFARADLFVFPTRGDCLPLAILEAAAAGLPIVATDIGAIGEAVLDNKTGRIVPIGNANALADATIGLLNNGALRQEMARAARRLACERFDAQTNYGRLVGLLSEVGDGGSNSNDEPQGGRHA